MTTNTDITLFQETLKTFYNTYLLKSALQNNVSTTTNYFYKELEDISNNSVSTTNYNEADMQKNFSDFIRGCINYNISSLYPLFKIKNTANNNAETAVIVNIHNNINLLNIILDIFDAYKNFIENNPLNFKEKLKDVTTIHLVNKKSRISVVNKKNTGFINENINSNNTLVLSINSFEKANSINQDLNPPITGTNITNEGRSGITPPNLAYFLDNIQASSGGNTYKRFSFTKPATGTTASSSENYKETPNSRTEIINNVLCFLLNLNPEEIRLNVLGLYYYYKYVSYQMLLTCSSINIMNNHLGSASPLPVINLEKLVPDGTTYNSDGFINDIAPSTKTPTEITTNFDNINSYINTDIITVIADLHTNSENTTDDKFNGIYAIDFTPKINPSVNLISSTNLTILLDSNVDVAIRNKLQSITENNVLKADFMDKFVFINNGTQFKITEITYDNPNIKIKILGQYSNSTASTDEALIIPKLGVTHPNDGTNSNTSLSNSKFMKKNLVTLKNDYLYNKKNLSSINTNIQSSIIKINNQKVHFNSNKNKDDLLNNQILSYNIILGSILAAFIMIHIINIEKGKRILLSMIFAGIIIVLIIVNYIINASYLEETFTNSNNIIENFATSKYTTVGELISPTNIAFTSYPEDKRDFINMKLNILNKKALDYFQKITAIIPLAESQDFYGELNGIMINEQRDKKNTDDILTYKKNLGNSNVDILKYSVNNKKVYVTSVLSIFFIFSILYVISLFIPDEYKNLIIFTAFIFGIIIFSYYIIFTSKLVKTKSNNMYWGPQTNDKF